ncbi:MAG: type II toxin-antitoxin system RelE/ParE family toxin [Bradymonadales bacterium]|nr:type II toxin-antitoxin system RelE/ParE family toxin [Bradymonadales bacterium]
MTEPFPQIFWTETASQDLEEIVTFIAADSPSNARRLAARMREKAASLQSHPARGRVVPELALFGFSTWREIVVKPYRLIYRADNERVVILAVLDGRREIEELLLKRLVRS